MSLLRAGCPYSAVISIDTPLIEPDGYQLLPTGGRFWAPLLNAWLKKNKFCGRGSKR
jgi:hypothetical protein